MIQHCVFLAIRSHVDESDVGHVLTLLSEFALGLSGVEAFSWGANHDFENKSPHYPYGFVVTFRDRSVLDTYAIHPQHKALGAQLVDMCDGGAEGIVVYDLVCD